MKGSLTGGEHRLCLSVKACWGLLSILLLACESGPEKATPPVPKPKAAPTYREPSLDPAKLKQLQLQLAPLWKQVHVGKAGEFRKALLPLVKKDLLEEDVSWALSFLAEELAQHRLGQGLQSSVQLLPEIKNEREKLRAQLASDLMQIRRKLSKKTRSLSLDKESREALARDLRMLQELQIFEAYPMIQKHNFTKFKKKREAGQLWPTPTDLEAAHILLELEGTLGTAP